MSSVPAVVAVLALCLALAAVPRYAHATEPSFDYTRVDSSAEEAICASEDLAALDRVLARAYRLALNDPHLTGDQASTLTAMQRGWIKGRNDSWKDGVRMEACLASSYVTRIDELRTGYAGARTDQKSAASIGPFSYRCDSFNSCRPDQLIKKGHPLGGLFL